MAATRKSHHLSCHWVQSIERVSMLTPCCLRSWESQGMYSHCFIFLQVLLRSYLFVTSYLFCMHCWLPLAGCTGQPCVVQNSMTWVCTSIYISRLLDSSSKVSVAYVAFTMPWPKLWVCAGFSFTRNGCQHNSLKVTARVCCTKRTRELHLLTCYQVEPVQSPCNRFRPILSYVICLRGFTKEMWNEGRIKDAPFRNVCQLALIHINIYIFITLYMMVEWHRMSFCIPFSTFRSRKPTTASGEDSGFHLHKPHEGGMVSRGLARVCFVGAGINIQQPFGSSTNK